MCKTIVKSDTSNTEFEQSEFMQFLLVFED